MKTTFLLEVEHAKPLHPDFIDFTAQRVYTFKGVKNTTVRLVLQPRSVPVPYSARDGEIGGASPCA